MEKWDVSKNGRHSVCGAQLHNLKVEVQLGGYQPEDCASKKWQGNGASIRPSFVTTSAPKSGFYLMAYQNLARNLCSDTITSHINVTSHVYTYISLHIHGCICTRTHTLIWALATQIDRTVQLSPSPSNMHIRNQA
eukprot:1161956-Pelagomonas_calceolata.AAC.7